MVFGGERPQQEMSQKSRLHETFFSLKNTDERPNSVMTEFMDTDWDQASVDIVSEIEDDENSPRHSLNSVRAVKDGVLAALGVEGRLLTCVTASPGNKV